VHAGKWPRSTEVAERKSNYRRLSFFLPEKSKDMIALDDALKRLEQVSPRQSRVVELRFFGGLEMEDIAKFEGVSLRTVKQDWSLARARLHHEIARGK
jgi:RNA polymerase sigma-70 factor (ECF subfamily)